MMLTKVLAVFGYNNTRIYDLIKIRKLAKERLQAEVLLIKEGINDNDREVVDYCMDFKVEDSGIIDPLTRFLTAHELQLIGCLPFSDKGVIGAAYAASHFGLVSDDRRTSFAMLDKTLFRKLEAQLQMDPNVYKKPFFTMAYSVQKLNETLITKGPFFVKPIAEGNSRGCMKVENQADLDRWINENSAALTAGVICEEILGNTCEYSFDGVDGSYWITEKFTTSGAYRAEYQHIIPAPFDAKTTQSIEDTLRPLLKHLGTNGGAFHHEFFLLDDKRVASVEPNRRPAGMWIWDLASWAFEDFDPWTRWIDWCGGKSGGEHQLKQKAFAGIRAVISTNDGKISAINREAIEKALTTRFGENNFRLSFLKDLGSVVRHQPRDNSDFLAFVALRHGTYETLLANLDAANQMILSNIEVAS